MSDRGAMVLALGLSKNLTLTRLYLAGNGLSDEAAALACRSARANLARANTLSAMGHPGLAAGLRLAEQPREGSPEGRVGTLFFFFFFFFFFFLGAPYI
jgi:hypothetical protein